MKPIARTIALIAALTASNVLAQDNAESRLLANPRQLVFEGVRSGEGYFSADGKKLVFQSEREAGNPFYQIYTLDFETGDTTRISPGIGKTTCAFLRPGTNEVLFASTHLDPEAQAKMKAEIDFRASGKSRRYAWDYDASMDLFVSPADGKGEPKRLTDSPGYDAEGSYSPDGKQIVFCSLRDAYPLEKLSAEQKKLYEVDPAFFGEIYIANADGSNPRRLTNAEGYDGGPFFSADGSRIIWRRFDKTGAFADIYSMKTDGSDVRRLTEFGSMSWAPYFHPSGDYVIFASNKFGFANFELFLVDSKGEKQPIRVTHKDGFDGLPVFSPDGQKLAWTSGRTADGKSQIFIADWNDAAARELLAVAPAREAKTETPAPAATPTPAVTATTGTAETLHAHVAFLASDEMNGRMTGSPESDRAAAYLIDQLKSVGFQAFDSEKTYLDPFDFSSGVTIDPAHTSLAVGDTKLELGKTFSPLAFSDSGTLSGEVVFAGYGLKTPGAGDHGYDSYAGADVKDKVVLVLRYVPEAVEPARKQELNRYASLRYKAMLARERGAKALLVVTGPNSPGAGELVAFSKDRDGPAGIPVISISGDVAEKWFVEKGEDLAALQARLDKEDPHAISSLKLGVTANIAAKLDRHTSTGRNVVAVLPPEESAGSKPEYIMLGAHYDHLGHGDVGSLHAGADHPIHNGADDNASGTAVVLEAAKALAEARKSDPLLRKRGVIVAFWSGEEIGVLGSSDFANKPPVPIEQVAAYLNFDMVGRLRENKLVMQGTGSSSVWAKLIEKRNVAAGFAITTQTDPYLPTDSTSFYSKGVPALNFFTGSHDDYHRPSDDIDTLSYEGMQRITKFATQIASDLIRADARPDYLKVESTNTGGRDALRVYLGTIPDYASEVKGLKLSGVRAGSPAEKGGLQANDVIVQFGEQAINNIYDYTYALEAARVNQPLKIIVVRGEERVELSVTPEARK